MELPQWIEAFNRDWLDRPSGRGRTDADARAFAAAASDLDPAVAMLEADPPEMDTWEGHGLLTAGGSIWAHLARHGRAPEHHWSRIRDSVRGFRAPAAEMRALLRSPGATAGAVLSKPLRFAPLLRWRTGQPVDTAPASWTRDMEALLSGWPGPLTLVLDGRALGFFPGDGRNLVPRPAWQPALEALVRAEAPSLVGLELRDLPLEPSFFSLLRRTPWFGRLRSLLLSPPDGRPWDLSALFAAPAGALETMVLAEEGRAGAQLSSRASRSDSIFSGGVLGA